MTSGADTGRYDPFEDTGDWPFRDAPPKRPDEAVADDPGHDAAPQDVIEDTPLGSPAEAEALALEDEPPFEELLPTPVETATDEVPPEPVVPEPEAVAVPTEQVTPPVTGLEVEAAAEVVVIEGEAPPEDADEELEAGTEHAPGALAIPPGVEVLAGGPHGFRRTVAVVVSRFNGDITTGLLESALGALRECNVGDDAITVVPVPGAFELPLTALALAKTRRFSCVVALGCIIRGETPHFDLIAGETASGLQLAAIETGIPVAFGVVTSETRDQAEARIDRGAEAARTALEMADLFSEVRTRAAAS